MEFSINLNDPGAHKIFRKVWAHFLTGTRDNIGHSVEQTIDGGYIVVGETSSYGAGGTDVWLIKTDEFGNVEPKDSNNDEPDGSGINNSNNGTKKEQKENGVIPSFESSLVLTAVLMILFFNVKRKKRRKNRLN